MHGNHQLYVCVLGPNLLQRFCLDDPLLVDTSDVAVCSWDVSTLWASI